MKKLVLCLIGMNLVAVPCYGDIIPTGHPKKSEASRETVKARLQELGETASGAETCVQRLSSDEVAFFANDTSRIQSAGNLYWYEWVCGLFVLVTIGLIAFYLQQQYVDR